MTRVQRVVNYLMWLPPSGRRLLRALGFHLKVEATKGWTRGHEVSMAARF
jgi:hypothetical protein